MMLNNYSCQQSVGKKSHSLVSCSPFLSKGQLISSYENLVIGAAIDWLDIHQQWSKTQGENVKIAVLDSGVAEHSNLKGAVVESVDYTDSQVDGKDIQGHGTHVIGIIAARRNKTGIVGIAPKASIYSAKVLSDSGVSDAQALVKAIYWAIQKKVHLISISLVCYEPLPQLEQAIKAATQEGILIVSAVGNQGKQIKAVYPASYSEVLAVGAISTEAVLASYSNWGSHVDIVAPGKFTSTYLREQYIEWEGTSMAVACVTGVLALFLEIILNRYGSTLKITPQELKRQVITTAIGLGKIGKNDKYGYGLIHPQKLLQNTKF